jgi:inhibitor of cysteine peptidase
MNTHLITFLILTPTILLASCAPALTYSKQDDGKVISVKVGDTFSITLDGNPTTGYAWETLPDSAALLTLVGEPAYNSSSDLLGAGGTYTFTFKAIAKGSTTLELIYHRSFETGVDPLETYTVTVEVK